MRPFIGPQAVDGRLTPIQQGRMNYAPEAPDYVDARVLTANVSEAHPIPAGARVVNFSADGNFYSKFATSTGSISVPTSDITNGAAPALNIGTRSIPANATHIILVAAQATVVTMEFWG